MAYGLEITNGVDGGLAVSDTISTYCHIGNISSWTYDPPAMGNGLSGYMDYLSHAHNYYANISSPAPPLVFMELPTAGGVAVTSIQDMGGGAYRIYLAAYGTSPTVAHVFASQKQVGQGSDTFGMRVWDASGAVLIDSGKKTLSSETRIGMVTLAASPNTDTINTGLSLSGKACCAMFCQCVVGPTFSKYDGSGYVKVMKQSGNNIVTSWQLAATAGSGAALGTTAYQATANPEIITANRY